MILIFKMEDKKLTHWKCFRNLNYEIKLVMITLNYCDDDDKFTSSSFLNTSIRIWLQNCHAYALISFNVSTMSKTTLH
jgi:hypothetical protein